MDQNIYTFRKPPVPQITREAYDKMLWISREFDKSEIEWRNELAVFTAKDGTVYLTVVGDPMLIHQDVGDYTVDVLWERETDWLCMHDDAGVDLNNIRVHTHSHVDLGTGPSPEDNKTFDKYTRHLKEGWFVRCIINHAGDLQFDAYDCKHKLVWADMDVAIVSKDTNEEFVTKMKKDIKEMVTFGKFERRKNNSDKVVKKVEKPERRHGHGLSLEQWTDLARFGTGGDTSIGSMSSLSDGIVTDDISDLFDPVRNIRGISIELNKQAGVGLILFTGNNREVKYRIASIDEAIKLYLYAERAIPMEFLEMSDLCKLVFAYICDPSNLEYIDFSTEVEVSIQSITHNAGLDYDGECAPIVESLIRDYLSEYLT